MRRYLLTGVLLAVMMAFVGMSARAMADEAAAPSEVKSMTMTGYVIDTKCATANQATLADFVKTHTKECAMACHETGYNMYSDGKLTAFDKDSSDKVYEFLGKADSKLNVTVEVMPNADGTLKLVSISNAA